MIEPRPIIDLSILGGRGHLSNLEDQLLLESVFKKMSSKSLAGLVSFLDSLPSDYWDSNRKATFTQPVDAETNPGVSMAISKNDAAVIRRVYTKRMQVKE